MPDNRSERLAADYRGMLTIQNRPYLSWIVTKGEPPCAEEYLLNVRLRTYALSARDGCYIVGAIPGCTVRVTLRDSYPNVAPYVTMLNVPPVFHPDWYSKGTYCASAPWRPEDSLKDFVMRMLGTLCYDPALMNTEAPANYKALDWYRKNRENTSLFPSDPTVLSTNSHEECTALEASALSFGEVIDSWPVR